MDWLLPAQHHWLCSCSFSGTDKIVSAKQFDPKRTARNPMSRLTLLSDVVFFIAYPILAKTIRESLACEFQT